MQIGALTEDGVQLVDPEGVEDFDQACREASDLVEQQDEINLIIVKKEE